MKHHEEHIQGAHGTRIYTQNWLPDGEPKAVVLIAHGLAEHSGRYGNVVNHLVPRGYAVYSFDQIGHGRSDGHRVYVKQFAEYIDTLKTYHDRLLAQVRGKPFFLLGHSLGGLIVGIYLLDYPDGVAGAVLSGPLVIAANVSPPVIAAGRILGSLIPRVRLLKVDASAISQDSSVVQAYVNDPLVYRGGMTARLGAEMTRAMTRLSAQAARITLPILIVQGSADQLVSPAGAQLLHKTIGSRDKMLKVYNGYHHEVFNEPGREAVLNDVAGWLNAHVQPY